MSRRPTRTIRIAAALILIVARVAAAPSQAPPTTADLQRRIGETGPALSFRAHGRLTATSADRRREVYQISVTQSRTPARTRMLWTISDPAPARLKLLVQVEQSGAITAWRQQGDRPPVKLTASQLTEPVGALGLYIEDLVSLHLGWPDQRATGAKPCGAALCYALESRPGERASQYSEVVSLVDRESFVPTLTRKQPRGGEPVREFRSLGTRPSGRYRVSTGYELTVPGRPGSTRVVMTGGSITDKIRDDELTLDPATPKGAAK